LLAAIICKQDVSKSAVTSMRFTTEDNRLIKWMWVSKIMQQNACSRYFFERRWSLDAL